MTDREIIKKANKVAFGISKELGDGFQMWTFFPTMQMRVIQSRIDVETQVALHQKEVCSSGLESILKERIRSGLEQLKKTIEESLKRLEESER